MCAAIEKLPQQPPWDACEPDVAALSAASQAGEVRSAERVNQFSATVWSSGKNRCPSNEQRHLVRYSVEDWDTLPPTAQACFEHARPPAPPRSAVTVRSEWGSLLEFLRRVVYPVSEVMEFDGDYMLRQVDGKLPKLGRIQAKF